MKHGPTAQPGDEDDINAHAARHQHDDPQVREAMAYHEYRTAKHMEAAAHHLKGADEASRRGEKQASDRHRLHYDLHRKALGLHKEVGVPAGIRARLAGAKINQHTRGFTPHPADQWTLR